MAILDTAKTLGQTLSGYLFQMPPPCNFTSFEVRLQYKLTSLSLHALAIACMALVSSSAFGQVRGAPWVFDVMPFDQDWSVGVLQGYNISSGDVVVEGHRESIMGGAFARRRVAGELTSTVMGAVAAGGEAVGLFGIRLDQIVHDPLQWTVGLVAGGAYAGSPANAPTETGWSADFGAGIALDWSPLVDVTPLKIWIIPRYTNRLTHTSDGSAWRHGGAVSLGAGGYLAGLGVTLVSFDYQYLGSFGSQWRQGFAIRYGF